MKLPEECKTVRGGFKHSSNVSCVFPFFYENETHHGCTKDKDVFWCSTKTDKYGFHIDGNWGICGPKCPLSGKNF